MENSQNEINLKTVLITGANKGIGYGIVRSLLQSKNYKIILTSRDQSRGEESVSKLIEEFPDQKDLLLYHQLDVTNYESIKSCAEWIKSQLSQIDILVNNAGVAVKGDAFDTDVFDFTFPTNVFGTVELTELLIKEDLIRKNGKIIIVGSTVGQLHKIKSEEIKSEFLASDLSIDSLFNLAKKFRSAIENETVEKDGWPRSVYAVSKMIINSYPKVLARKDEIKERNIQVNSLCPGWVRTDMAGPKAKLSIEEGVLTPVYLIGMADGINHEYQGKFFYERQVFAFDK